MSRWEKGSRYKVCTVNTSKEKKSTKEVELKVCKELIYRGCYSVSVKVNEHVMVYVTIDKDIALCDIATGFVELWNNDDIKGRYFDQGENQQKTTSALFEQILDRHYQSAHRIDEIIDKEVQFYKKYVASINDENKIVEYKAA